MVGELVIVSPATACVSLILFQYAWVPGSRAEGWQIVEMDSVTDTNVIISLALRHRRQPKVLQFQTGECAGLAVTGGELETIIESSQRRATMTCSI